MPRSLKRGWPILAALLFHLSLASQAQADAASPSIQAATVSAETAMVPAPTPEPAKSTFVRDFSGLGGDFKRVVTDNWEVLGLGGGMALLSSQFDDNLNDADPAGSSESLGFGATAGNGAVQGGLALGAYAIGRLSGQTKVGDVGRDLIRAQLVSGVLTLGIKGLTRRQRPDESGRTSFPSGHTSTAFASATVLERHFGWKAGIPAYALATYVAASRVENHRHYLSDVVFGATVGIAAGRSLHIGRSRVGIMPMMTQAGPAVGVRVSLP